MDKFYIVQHIFQGLAQDPELYIHESAADERFRELAAEFYGIKTAGRPLDAIREQIEKECNQDDDELHIWEVEPQDHTALDSFIERADMPQEAI